MTEQTPRKMPQIRFKGFTREWEEQKTHSLADRYDNLRIPISASKRVPGPTPYYGANGIQDYVQGYTHDGEFILVAEDGANDLKNYPVQYVNGKVWVNNHAHVLQGKMGFADTLFLKFAFSQVNIEKFLVGGGRAKLNAETMMHMELCAPLDLTEQIQIGGYFRELDRLIGLHQRKHDKLLSLKKAMLQKMFTQPAATTPEIRFTGFSGDWVKKDVSEICGESYGGGTPRTSERKFWEGAIPWIQSSDLIDGEIYTVAPRKHISELAVRKSPTKLVPAKSIAIVTRVGVGKLALMEFSYAASQDFVSLSKLKIDPSFAAVALSVLLQSKLHETQGTSIKGITKDELLAYSFTIPHTAAEQQKIGTYFRTLDKLITKQFTNLQKLKQVKSAFLEKMFA